MAENYLRCSKQKLDNNQILRAISKKEDLRSLYEYQTLDKDATLKAIATGEDL